MDKGERSLELIQQRFAEALLNLDAVGSAMPLFAQPTSMTEARLAFYRGNMTSVWYAALANAYPVLLQLVGNEFFEQLARAYGQAFPSQCGDLNHFGDELSTFLLDIPMLADYPYFVDVATLEWAVHRAYYAADASILTLPGLIASAGANMQNVRLVWHPAAQLHASNTASVSVWRAHQGTQEESIPLTLTEPGYGLITRHEWHVSVLSLSEAAFPALQALSQRSSLGDALELALAADAEFDIAGALNTWFSAGAFSGYEVCKE